MDQPGGPPRFTMLRPGHSYPRTPPRVVNLHADAPAVLESFNATLAQRSVICPPEGVFHFDRCYVYDGCYVLALDLEWLPDSVIDLGVAETIKPVMQDVIAGNHHQTLPRTASRTVVIAKSGADNYGHTLTDILPKLLHVRSAGLTDIRLLLPLSMARYQPLILDVLSHAGVTTEILLIPPATLQAVADVTFIGPVARHNTRKSATFLDLRDLLASLYGIVFNPSRRLFVRRGPQESRRLLNSPAVEALFAARGYETVYPADLPLQEQMRLFASASHVAGPLGAGLANIGFCPPGCTVTMIDPGLGDFYFWDFTCLLRQRFNWIFSGALRGYTPALSLADFSCDVAMLASALQRLQD